MVNCYSTLAVVATAFVMTCAVASALVALNPSVPSTSRRAATSKNVIYFNDGSNFDDTLSLMLLQKSPYADIEATYIAGNGWGNVGPSIRNFYHLLHLFGDEKTPVLAGSYWSLEDEMNAAADYLPANKSHNPFSSYRTAVPMGSGGSLYCDTIWGLSTLLPKGSRQYNPMPTTMDAFGDPASDVQSWKVIAAIARGLPKNEKLSFISTGPLTAVSKLFNPAIVSISDRDAILARIEGLYLMGGAVYVDGNLFSMCPRWAPPINQVNCEAEFNMYEDPHAAQWTFGNFSSRSIPITMVPLDGTNHVPFPDYLLNELVNAPNTPEAQFMGLLMANLKDTWYDPINFYTTAYLWDPTSIIVMLYPSVVETKTETGIKVVINQGPSGAQQGETQICTIGSIGCSKINVVTEINGDSVGAIILSLMQSKINSAKYPLAIYA